MTKWQKQTKVFGRVKRVLDLVSHPGRHQKVLSAVQTPVLRMAREKQPQITLKYLHPRYLVRGISTNDRANAMIHHYSILDGRFSGPFVAAVIGDGQTIWTYETESGTHSVTMRFSHPTDNEGELTLEYKFCDTLLHLLSFSFASGTIASMADKTIVLLTRIQGVKSDFEMSRAAMKSIRGLAGANILMAALQGVAEALDVDKIIATSAVFQVCYEDGQPSNFTAAYDEFFMNLGGVQLSPAFYSIGLPIPEKDISEVKPSNRAKVRAQRELKRQIQEGSGEALALTAA